MAGTTGLTVGKEPVAGAAPPVGAVLGAVCDQANPEDPALAESPNTRDSIRLAAASRIGLEDLGGIFVGSGFRPGSILTEKSI